MEPIEQYSFISYRFGRMVNLNHAPCFLYTLFFMRLFFTLPHSVSAGAGAVF